MTESRDHKDKTWIHKETDGNRNKSPWIKKHDPKNKREDDRRECEIKAIKADEFSHEYIPGEVTIICICWVARVRLYTDILYIGVLQLAL